VCIEFISTARRFFKICFKANFFPRKTSDVDDYKSELEPPFVDSFPKVSKKSFLKKFAFDFML
jgi:hypothetical protein